jgi:proline iminopeptidase
MRPAAADIIAGPRTRAKLRAALAGVDDPVQPLWTTVELLAEDPEAQTRYSYHDPAIAAAVADGPDYGFNEQLCRALVGTERAELLDELAELDLPTLVMTGLWNR